jgi:hypothetical protein
MCERLPTDNRTVKVDGREVRTRWENNRLISEIAVGNPKVLETYERLPGSQQLIVAVSAEVHGQQVSVRRVYDPVRK